jgi:hypothetical protein
MESPLGLFDSLACVVKVIHGPVCEHLAVSVSVARNLNRSVCGHSLVVNGAGFEERKKLTICAYVRIRVGRLPQRISS